MNKLADLCKKNAQFHNVKIVCFLFVIVPASIYSEVLFSNNFDANSTGQYTVSALETGWSGVTWEEGVSDGRVYIVDGSDARSGKSLRVSYPQGWALSGRGAQWWHVIGGSHEDLYCSYFIKFQAGFDFVKGGKLPGLAGGECNTGGDKPDGTDGWSGRIMWRAGGDVVQYVYHVDQPTIYGEDFDWAENGGQRSFSPGTWHHVETRIKMNTPGQHDGIVQSWFDGTLALDVQNICFRTVSSFAIEKLLFSTFFGGGDATWAPTKDEFVYFDDFIISTTRVGPGAVPVLSPEITVSFLPVGVVGTSYSTTFEVTKGSEPYVWSLLSGTLPAGISLGTDGTLSGIPTLAGLSEFAVTVIDSEDSTDNADVSMRILSENSINLISGTTYLGDSENFSTGNPVTALWDGDISGSSAGSPGNTGQDSFWVEFDLGGIYDLSLIRLMGDAEGTWVSTLYSVLVKTDVSDNSTAIVNNEACFGNQWYETETDLTARYLRLSVTGDTDVHAVQAREFEVYGTPTSTIAVSRMGNVLKPEIYIKGSDMILRFSIPEATRARLSLYDIQGRIAGTPFKENIPAGRHEINLGARRNDVAATGSGIYISRLFIGNEYFTIPMITGDGIRE